MPRIKSDEKGFTLIEVIVTLILVGITTALAGMWIVSVVNGYVFAKTNADTVQKGQLAMTRLAKEFAAIASVTGSNGTSITYKRTNSDLTTSGEITVAVATGTDELQIGGSTLTDSVSGFTLRYCANSQIDQTACPRTTWAVSAGVEPSSVIEIELTLTAADNTGKKFTKRIAPRNL